MKQQEVFRKTGEILKELSDQYEDLKSTSNALNDLELELFIANAHFLIDHAEILRKLNLQKEQLQHTLPPHIEEKKLDMPKPEPVKAEILKPVVEEIKRPISVEPKYFEPLVQQAKPVIQTPFKPEQLIQQQPIQIDITAKEDKPAPHIDLGKATDTDSYSFEREEPEIIKHDLVVDETNSNNWDQEIEAQPVVPQQREKPQTNAVTMESILDNEITNTDDETREPNVIPTNPEPVIDNSPKVKQDEPEPAKEEQVLTLNQRMSAQLKGNNNSPVPVEAPIKDIKSAISLNDKLLFVKDLFNGYNLAYSEAIEIVNRFTNFEEADRFLKTNYVTKNNWEGKKATMDKFYTLLKRRYA